MTAPAITAVVARLLAEGPAATALLELPGGQFEMGSPGRPDELPARTVEVAPFAVSLLPVTNAEFAHFLAATGHEPSRFWDDPRFNAPAQPVVGVSWFDAVDYCEWLTTLLGRRCRLPTEAEREFAARGGLLGAAYPWGDAPWTDGPFALGAAGTDRPLEVGSTPPNGYGVYHMGENVHEWCRDWYDARGYADLATRDPERTTTEPEWTAADIESGVARRASRGGSWRHHVKVSRIAARSSLAPDRRYNDYGMRVYADAAGAERG